MRLFFPIALSLLSFLPYSLASDDILGGALVAGTSLLKPFIKGSPLTDTTRVKLQRREPTVIEGLLQTRQSCQSGWGRCSNGGCCPLGGRCCTNDCCDAGFWCYSTGCCRLTEIGCDNLSCCPTGSNCCKGGTCCGAGDYCVEGGACCPIGKICSEGASRRCIDPGFEPCPNDDFCCPPGETCYRDSSNIPRCRSGSGGGGITTITSRTIPTTTPRTTSNPTSSPDTELPDIPSISTTGLANSTSSTRSTISTQSPRPTPAAGQTTVTYGASDTRINWSGSGWISASSSCSISARRTTTEMQSFTLTVDSAARLYLNLDCLNVVYDVYVNSVVQTFVTDTFDVTQTCTYRQVNLGSNMANINVTVVVIGLPRNGRRQVDNNWSFQLNEVLAMTSTSTTPPSSAGTGGAFGSKALWFQGMVTALLAGFGLVL